SAATYENYANYPRERDSIIQLITAENIPGVIFLSGDRHNTELSKLERPGTYPLYDLTISPLTAGINTHAHEEANTLRVDGTLYEGRNFAVVNVSGTAKERQLTIYVYNTAGEEIWTRIIKAAELKKAK
ncbi:MAG: alkaline phosphatase family protein, partial [Bacteroidota bacterium]|nr:alkaline phosphatase family protein [Bacteroidota bacterium]